MSDMKCPFCQQELQIIGEKSDSGFPIDEYICPSCDVPFGIGNKPMWHKLRVEHDKLETVCKERNRLEQELICTRKALDAAVVALKFVANTALEQITALEQKVDSNE